MLAPMTADPKGYYARLGVAPNASAADITAAFRREARRLHPDVPVTGNADAFVELKTAYDVLSAPLDRAAYDRSAHQPRPAPIPAESVLHSASSMFGTIPVVAWLGMSGFAIVAVIAIVLNLQDSGPPPAAPVAANTTITPPPSPSETQRPAGQSPILLEGQPTHYVTSGAGPVTLWRLDRSAQHYVPVARLAPFTPVHAIGIVPEHGFMVILLAGGDRGFVDAARMTPGGADAAHRAFCADQAGPPPANAELLARRSTGNAKLIVQNRGGEPAVVKLRDQREHTAAAIFVAPGITATVINLPDGPWRADVAVGELWSRACGIFAAGMRAQRLPGIIESGGHLSLPLDLPDDMPPLDISDQSFARE